MPGHWPPAGGHGLVLQAVEATQLDAPGGADYHTPMASLNRSGAAILWTRAILVSMAILLPACRSHVTRFEVIDYSPEAEPLHYFQEFDECYYRVDGEGNIDIVARRRGSPTNREDDGPVQVVHLRSIFRPVPGLTPVERTMTNATVSYIILDRGDGVSFDGAGFLLCKIHRNGRELTATLEESTLQPMRHMGAGPQVFQRPRVTGRIHAQLDPRRTHRILNETRHLLGPVADTIPRATTRKNR